MFLGLTGLEQINKAYMSLFHTGTDRIRTWLNPPLKDKCKIGLAPIRVF